jgi:hypothetical protein
LNVDFFIAGVQKGGTTALDAMLRHHPAIQMSDVKEAHVFDDETMDWSAPDYGRLHRHFAWSQVDVLRGEASPIYVYWPNSLERLKAYNPSAKLIVGLRHPAFRAFSHWKMERSRNAETLSFSEAIRAGRERVRTASGGVDRVFSYVERGLYGAQIERLQKFFPASQLHVFRTDALWLEPEATVRAIEVFLGIEPCLLPRREYIVPFASDPAPMMSAEDRNLLDDIFQESIETAAKATGLDLKDWLSPDYAEPMRPSES